MRAMQTHPVPHPVPHPVRIPPHLHQVTANMHRGPVWRRSALPPAHRHTRVYSVAGIPDLGASPEPPRRLSPDGPVWRANQHSSPSLRPADVVVYVGPGDGSPSEEGSLVGHLRVQASETLHAILVLGAVCGPASTLAYVPR